MSALIDFSHPSEARPQLAMSSAAADLLHARVPNLDSELSDYLSSCAYHALTHCRSCAHSFTDLRDPASCQSFEVDQGEELESLIRPTLEGEGVPEDEVESLLNDLMKLMGSGLGGTTNGGPAKLLDKVVTLNSGPALHATLLSGAVDISSTTKGRETQVDMRKLEKAEAKLKAKAEKRAKRTGLDLYEGSKLVDAAKAQVRFLSDCTMNLTHQENSAPMRRCTCKSIRCKPSMQRTRARARTFTWRMSTSHSARFGSSMAPTSPSLTGAVTASSVAMVCSISMNYGTSFSRFSTGIGKSTLLRAMSVREVAIPCADTPTFLVDDLNERTVLTSRSSTSSKRCTATRRELYKRSFPPTSGENACWRKRKN